MNPVIDETEVRRIARLSRLELSDEEVRRFAGQLAHIVDYVRQIESLDTEDVEPLAHALPITDVLREDEPAEGLTHEQAVLNAPETERGFFRVPAVLDPHGGA
jgi:aspartyl-tRNA(Asn)/glutamyl-tRNA(Gln) amidotransferase subunit C